MLSQSVAFHGEAIGAERIGEDHLAARLHVSARDRFHAIRVRQVPMVRAFARFQTARLKFRPPRAISQDRSLRNELLDQSMHLELPIFDLRLTIEGAWVHMGNRPESTIHH
jgi:hypothetical protein